MAHLGAESGGLTASVAEEAPREAVLAALKARRAYATNGPRILLRAAVAGQPMGSEIAVGDDGLRSAELSVMAWAMAPVERVDVVRSGKVAASTPGRGLRDGAMTLPLTDLRPGEYVCCRLVEPVLRGQVGAGLAVSSPPTA